MSRNFGFLRGGGVLSPYAEYTAPDLLLDRAYVLSVSRSLGLGHLLSELERQHLSQ
jgi:hypothetical protein